ncbi:hypothetical protein GF354_06370 [Candidatus Peregrinibacteria bacterium]|nr:hypothetical protein [Candidatus Peregrinibacteria bacterium]
MDIIWHEKSSFTLKGKNATVVINPGKDGKKLSGDIVLSSLGTKTAKVEGAMKVFDWPGEYEVSDIPIIGYSAWTKSRSDEEENGSGDRTILFYFEIEGIKICHLGSLGHVLSSDVVNSLGDVDILMINATEESNLTLKKIMEIVESIDPRAIIPMGDGNNQAFFKEVGVENTEGDKRFSIKNPGELPDEDRQIIILQKN